MRSRPARLVLLLPLLAILSGCGSLEFLVERFGGGRAHSEDKSVPPSFLLTGRAAALQDSLRDRLLWIRREVSDSRWKIETVRFENVARAIDSLSTGNAGAAMADTARAGSAPAEMARTDSARHDASASIVPATGGDSVRLLLRVRDTRSMNSHGSIGREAVAAREREQVLEGFAPALEEPLRASGIREPVRVLVVFRHRNFLRSSSRYTADSAMVELPAR